MEKEGRRKENHEEEPAGEERDRRTGRYSRSELGVVALALGLSAGAVARQLDEAEGESRAGRARDAAEEIAPTANHGGEEAGVLLGVEDVGLALVPGEGVRVDRQKRRRRRRWRRRRW